MKIDDLFAGNQQNDDLAIARASYERTQQRFSVSNDYPIVNTIGKPLKGVIDTVTPRMSTRSKQYHVYTVTVGDNTYTFRDLFTHPEMPRGVVPDAGTEVLVATCALKEELKGKPDPKSTNGENYLEDRVFVVHNKKA